ncbi:unnamed protein product [Cylindrotheca closterium]|nr:unnamed protein product [Cylindrotheca closterium]
MILSQDEKEILKEAKRMVRYRKALADSKGTNHKDKIVCFFKILHRIFKKLIKKGAQCYSPSTLDKNSPLVVYACVQLRSNQREPTLIKVGKTLNWEERMKHIFITNETFTFAMALATLDEIKELIDADDIQEIVNLKFASFGTHTDHTQVSIDEIYLYVYEAFMACAIQGNAVRCITVHVLERFVLVPTTGSQLIQNAKVRRNGVVLENPDELDETNELDTDYFVVNEFKSFFFGNDEVPEDLIIKLILTWATTKSKVYNMAPEEYLGTILKDLPEGDFLKLYLLIKGAFCGRNVTYQDVIERPPGIELLETVVQDLLALPPNPQGPQIDAILNPILNGTYIHPTGQDLANAFVAKYVQLVAENTPHTIHYVEQCQIDALQTHCPTFFNQEFEEGESFEVEDFLKGYWTKRNLKFIVTHSHFVSFSPNTSRTSYTMESRIHNMKSLLVFLYLSSSIGLTNDKNDPGFQQFVLAMEGYHMDLEAALQSQGQVWPRFRAIQCLPQGYLKGSFVHAGVVARNIRFGLEVSALLYIQFRMLEDGYLIEFLNFLRACGIHLGDNRDLDWNSPCPSFPNFECTGLPQTVNFPPRGCHSVGSEEGDTFCMYGASVEPDALVCPGRMMCRSCHRLMEVRERDILRGMVARTGCQQRRLTFLEQRTRTAQRHRQMANQGSQSFLEAERFRARLNESQHYWVSHRRRSAIRDATRTDNRSGTHMEDTTRTGLFEYNDSMQEVLKWTLLVLFQHYPLEMDRGNGGRRVIPKQTLQKCLMDVLQVVGPVYNLTGPRAGNRIKYRKPGFERAFNEALDHVPNTLTWQVKQQYLAFVTDGTRPDWYKKKVHLEIIPEVKRIILQDLNRYGRP